MLAEARRLLAADRVPEARQRIEMRVDMRYIGQSYELPIPLGTSPVGAGQSHSKALPLDGGGLGRGDRRGHAAFTAEDWAGLPYAFHAEHRRRFGHSDPAAPIEIVSFAVTATGLIDTPELPRPATGTREPPAEARSGTRRVYFEAEIAGSGGWHEAPVWRREALLGCNEIAGPAIVEEISATTVLYPGDHARVDEIGSLIVDIGL
jgi:N-methylhydantoinase A